MGRVPPPKEDSGCIQTLLISKVIWQILLVPMGMILGAVILIVVAFSAYASNVLYGAAVLLIGAAVLYVVAQWEWRRVQKELPPEDDSQQPPTNR